MIVFFILIVKVLFVILRLGVGVILVILGFWVCNFFGWYFGFGIVCLGGIGYIFSSFVCLFRLGV